MLLHHHILKVGYSSSVLSVINRFKANGTPLIQSEINKIQVFVDGLVSDGIWNFIDDFFWFKNIETEAKSLLGFKSLSITKVGTPSWSTSGWTSFSTSNYLNTNFNPKTFSGNYSLNSAIFGTWVTTSASFIGGCSNGSTFWCRLSASGVNSTNHNSTNFNVTAPSSQLIIQDRSSNTLVTGYVAGSAAGNNTSAALDRPNFNFYLGTFNNNGTPNGNFGGTIGCFIFGGSLGATNESNLNSRITTLLS